MMRLFFLAFSIAYGIIENNIHTYPKIAGGHFMKQENNLLGVRIIAALFVLDRYLRWQERRA